MSVRLFIGWPGFGKSLAMQDMAADAVADGHVIYTVDRAKEWAPEATDEEGRSRWRNAPPERILEWPQECERPELVKRLQELRDSDDDERGALVRFDFPWDGYSVGALAREVGDCTVMDDEADYTSARGQWEVMHRERKCPCGDENCALGSGGYSLNPYRDFVHRGRHVVSPLDGLPRRVHLVGAMRRPENVHTDLTGIADEVMLFRIGGHTTLDRIVKEGWLSEEHLEELQELPKLHYFLHRKGERQPIRGVVAGLE